MGAKELCILRNDSCRGEARKPRIIVYSLRCVLLVAGWTPRSLADFGDGGAFPEIHMAQPRTQRSLRSRLRTSKQTFRYPLDMGKAGKTHQQAPKDQLCSRVSSCRRPGSGAANRRQREDSLGCSDQAQVGPWLRGSALRFRAGKNEI